MTNDFHRSRNSGWNSIWRRSPKNERHSSKSWLCYFLLTIYQSWNVYLFFVRFINNLVRHRSWSKLPTVSWSHLRMSSQNPVRNERLSARGIAFDVFYPVRLLQFARPDSWPPRDFRSLVKLPIVCSTRNLRIKLQLLSQRRIRREKIEATIERTSKSTPLRKQALRNLFWARVDYGIILRRSLVTVVNDPPICGEWEPWQRSPWWALNTSPCISSCLSKTLNGPHGASDEVDIIRNW